MTYDDPNAPRLRGYWLQSEAEAYADRVAALIHEQGGAYRCKHGHGDCAEVPGGMCSDEMLSTCEPDPAPMEGR